MMKFSLWSAASDQKQTPTDVKIHKVKFYVWIIHYKGNNQAFSNSYLQDVSTNIFL